MGKKIYFYRVIFLLIFLLGCVKSTPDTIISPGLLYKLLQQRDKSEDAIKEAKLKFKDAPEKLAKAERLYQDIYRKGNAFIVVMQTKLSDQSFDEKELEPQAKDLVIAVLELDGYVYETKSVTEIVTICQALLKVAGSVKELYIKHQVSGIEKLKKELDNYKWRPLDEIK